MSEESWKVLFWWSVLVALCAGFWLLVAKMAELLLASAM